MSEEDTEYTDNPTCPYCGYEIQNVSDYDGAFYSEELYEFDCPDCEKPVRCQAHISFSYTTTCIDREAEAKKKAERKAKDDERTAKRLIECQKWLPGTRIRIREDSTYADWLRGRVGVVANREITRHNPFVEIDLEATRDYKPYSTFCRPEELERI